MNPPTIIVGLVVLAILVAIIARSIRNKKLGKSDCSCGSECGGCPGSEFCHPSQEK